MPTKFFAFLIISAALLAGREERPERVPPKGAVVTVVPTAETAVMPDADDAADDPAIWVHPGNPEQSLIIGTNKQRGLVVYHLDGREASKRDDGRMNNVDLRQNVTVGHFTGDLVAATNRDKKSIDVYSLDGASATLTPVLSIPTGFADPYGLCLYRSAKTGELYIIANNSGDGMVGQWRVTADTLAFEAQQVRSFSLGSQAEGCAADNPEARDEAFELIRSLIDQVVLVPAGKALEIEIKGELAGILELCAGARKEKPGTVSSAGLAEQLKMVAGARIVLYRTKAR